MKMKTEIGNRFGKLTVISRAENQRQGRSSRAMWNCVCDCGGTSTVRGTALRSGQIIGCGCQIGAHRITHRKSGSSEHVVWLSMMARCYDENNPAFRNYGGRGITVADEWKSFIGFYEDMGDRPSPLMSIDRINNDGPYSKDNCRWATRTEQNRNRRNTCFVEFNGETKVLAEWCEQLGLDRKRVHRRLRRGWSAVEAFRN